MNKAHQASESSAMLTKVKQGVTAQSSKVNEYLAKMQQPDQKVHLEEFLQEVDKKEGTSSPNASVNTFTINDEDEAVATTT